MTANDDEVRRIVRRILGELIGDSAATPVDVRSPQPAPLNRAQAASSNRKVIDEAEVRALPTGATLLVESGAVVTPLARQVALERRISLTSQDQPAAAKASPATRSIAVGADHGGFALKEALRTHLGELGYQVVDCGTHSTDPVDYPDIAYAVARLVAEGKCVSGIMVDGAGIGSCMAANKVPGVRAALCYDLTTAVNSREHNHANVLTLGAGLVAVNLAKQIVTTWLGTAYGPGRHAARVAKITAIERRHFK